MPFSAIGPKVCKNLQAAYVDYFQKNASEFKTGGDTSVIKWLLSPQNTAGFKKIDVTSIPGKKRGVAFDVEQALCFDVTAPVVDCTTTRVQLEDPSKEAVFDLTGPAFRATDSNGAPTKLTITEDEMNKHCTETDQSYVQRKILKHLRRYEEALDKAVAQVLAVKAGTNAAGETVTRLPFFVKNASTGTSAINSDSVFMLDQYYSDIIGDGQYGLLGGRTLNKLKTLLRWTGLNEAGIDLSSVDSVNPYVFYSRHLDNILGPNGFLQLSPGSAQLVYFNDYMGDRKKAVTDLYRKDTIISPATGLPIDYMWEYDYKCGVYTFEPHLHLEVATNIAGGCGPLETTNGIIKYEDCSWGAQPIECPEPAA